MLATQTNMLLYSNQPTNLPTYWYQDTTLDDTVSSFYREADSVAIICGLWDEFDYMRLKTPQR